MIREFLTATFCMMRWKIFQWMKFLLILQIQENWAGKNFITNSHVYDCSLRKQKCRLKSTTNGWRHFGQSEQRKSSVLFPIQSEKMTRFWRFRMWSVKELYHALLPKTDYRDGRGRGHGRTRLHCPTLFFANSLLVASAFGQSISPHLSKRPLLPRVTSCLHMHHMGYFCQRNSHVV